MSFVLHMPLRWLMIFTPMVRWIHRFWPVSQRHWEQPMVQPFSIRLLRTILLLQVRQLGCRYECSSHTNFEDVADLIVNSKVFDAIAAECFKQQIYVHLDNHVSKAIWCCSNTDGNSWFGDTYFNVSNWQRGIAYMATRVSHFLLSSTH